MRGLTTCWLGQIFGCIRCSRCIAQANQYRPNTREAVLESTAKGLERAFPRGGLLQECLQADGQQCSPKHDGGAHKEVLCIEGPPAERPRL